MPTTELSFWQSLTIACPKTSCQLGGVPGFIEFHLLRGPERDDHVLYSSHTLWASQADFEAWTRSEAFRRAHRDAGSNRPLYLGHPEFEGFEVIQTVDAAAAGKMS